MRLPGFYRVLEVSVALAAFSLAGYAQSDVWTRNRLSGDWGGLRTSMEEAGLTVEAYYTLEMMQVADGGVRRSTNVLGNLDLLLTADLEKLAGWPDTEFFLYVLVDHGDNPSEDVGDYQVVSNIEAPDTVRVFDAWIQKTWLDGTVSGLVGLYDVNSEFDVIPAAGVFLHSSHGIGGDFGNSGRNGPSIFPVTSLAARLKLRPSEWSYVHAVVADGVPGDPNDPYKTTVRFANGDGVLLAGEVGFFNLPSEDLRRKTFARATKLPPEEQRLGYFGKYALGVWGYTGEFDDFSRVDSNGNPIQHTGSHGAYVLAEQQLFYEAEDPRQGLSIFGRAGFADERVQVVDRYLGAGLVYRGLFPERGNDILGLGVAAARFGPEFQRAASGGGTWHDWEIAIEFTYQAELAPWLSIQPDVQYVIHPGGNPQLDDALVIGVRGVVSF